MVKSAATYCHITDPLLAPFCEYLLSKQLTGISISYLVRLSFVNNGLFAAIKARPMSPDDVAKWSLGVDFAKFIPAEHRVVVLQLLEQSNTIANAIHGVSDFATYTPFLLRNYFTLQATHFNIENYPTQSMKFIDCLEQVLKPGPLLFRLYLTKINSHLAKLDPIMLTSITQLYLLTDDDDFADNLQPLIDVDIGLHIVARSSIYAGNHYFYRQKIQACLSRTLRRIVEAAKAHCPGEMEAKYFSLVDNNHLTTHV